MTAPAIVSEPLYLHESERNSANKALVWIRFKIGTFMFRFERVWTLLEELS
jgi:hypothetical protein